ncbi:Hsp20/alpha crystallin family protein [Arthrobacter sp. SPG23]|uniref:Hsp20/alpha crystallin family protein n=1 Tax=Arthrobacter sp. SPG23 TaxID=1610703 RepID=UPI0009E65A26|nr:Hsp20/alpha crystallin family protein [Arthrobacter sp. SPG23]
MHSLDRLFDSQRFRSEFRYGPFGRSVPLPDDVKEGDIKATYSDGVLEVPANLQTKQRSRRPRRHRHWFMDHTGAAAAPPPSPPCCAKAAGQLLSPGFRLPGLARRGRDAVHAEPGPKRLRRP